MVEDGFWKPVSACSSRAFRTKKEFLTTKTTTMTRLKISRWQLLVALVLARRVVVVFKPEIKLATLLLMAWLGNEYINSTADYGVCILALLQKYRRLIA